jgi:phosphatidate cytidylyltransferase
MTWKRVLTAAVLIPIVVGLVLWGSTAAVALGFALVTLLALFEYFILGAAIGHRAYRFWTATCSLLLVYVQWLAAGSQRYPLAGGVTLYRTLLRFVQPMPPTFEGAFFLFALGVMLLIVFTRRPLAEAIPAAGLSASGLLLIALPFSFGIRLHAAGAFGPRLLLFAMVIIWVGDTCAYFVGRNLGKWKLSPKLSPNKTWEGTVASLAGSVAAGYLFRFWIPVSTLDLLAMAVLGNIAGQVGDLAESGYKRSAGVKDSGRLLPGHGGVLDRIDALILAIPVVWYYWILFSSAAN